MGRVKKGELCSVDNCSESAIRSISLPEAKILEEKGLKLTPSHGAVYLCKTHYKLFKKLVKKESKLMKWRMK